MSYLIRRLLTLVITLLLVSVVAFVIVQVVPGDPAQLVLGTEAPAEALAEMRAKMGLDRPPLWQYLTWLGRAIRGDLGTSWRHERPVSSLIAERLPVTLSLTVLALSLALLVAIPLGILAATQRRTILDYACLLFAQLGLVLPSFWLGILLILLLALTWRWLPSGGYVNWSDDPLQALRHLIMPALALSLPLAGTLARLVRASMLEELGRDYIRTARAKGLSEQLILYRHALRNALIPAVTLAGLQVGFLLGGSIVIEQVFALPGVGRLVLLAIYNRDLPLIQGLVVFIAAVVVIVNLMVDLLYVYLDPKVSLT